MHTKPWSSQSTLPTHPAPELIQLRNSPCSEEPTEARRPHGHRFCHCRPSLGLWHYLCPLASRLCAPRGGWAKGVGRIMFWAEQHSDLSKHLKAGDRKTLSTQSCSSRSELARGCPLGEHVGTGGPGERPQGGRLSPTSPGKPGSQLGASQASQETGEAR